MTELALSLAGTEWHPIIGCFIDQGERAAELRGSGILIIRFPVRSFASLSTILAFRMMRRVIHEHKIMLAHSFDVPMNIFAVPAARFGGCRVVLSSQRAYRTLSSPRERYLLWLTDKIADGVVVNCEALRRHMSEDERVTPDRIHLCYNGIRASTFFPKTQPRPDALASASLVIGAVCVLRPEKGLSTLLRAFAAVHRHHPGIKLAIVGSGPELLRLQSLASQLGVSESVHFEPATKDVLPWLRSMDIFVLPSLSEALSNSLMEAMVCGCTVVASRTGGNPELVADGITGLSFAPGEAGQLSQCLLRLVEDQLLRRNLSAAGAKFIKEKFSMEQSVETMTRIYRKLLTEKAKSVAARGQERYQQMP